MSNLRQRLLRAERSVASKARNASELRVAGKSVKEARRELMREIHRAASGPGLPGRVKADCEQAIARLKSLIDLEEEK
ncbi:MAG: hypothetical protein ACKV2Q_28110 [Planctomycetaceae bacterium]